MKGPKTEKIRTLFNSIAKDYDKLNHILSLGVDRIWRKRSIKYIVENRPQQILDIACGTGDFSLEIARRTLHDTDTEKRAGIHYSLQDGDTGTFAESLVHTENC